MVMGIPAVDESAGAGLFTNLADDSADAIGGVEVFDDAVGDGAGEVACKRMSNVEKTVMGRLTGRPAGSLDSRG